MNIQDVVQRSLGRAKMVTGMLLEDLTDTDIMQRPVAEANHIAWQLGHLISSLNAFGNLIKRNAMPPLPEGFSEQHSKATAGNDDSAAFLSKRAYLVLLEQQRDAMMQLLSELSDEQFESESPEKVRGYAPRIVDLVTLIAEHEMMHAGQMSVLRRKLHKPLVF